MVFPTAQPVEYAVQCQMYVAAVRYQHGGNAAISLDPLVDPAGFRTQ